MREGGAGGQPPMSNDHRHFICICQGQNRKKGPISIKPTHSAQSPRGFLSAQKNLIFLGLVFRPFPDEVFGLRFGLEKV
jgi:hypothetical protein